ncbi:MAG TPA: LUD domain-containing protein [Hyphomicrobiaceae bacterium]|nr:LUD domain-containing protein [Hyphomicrobiaceae bacterium]
MSADLKPPSEAGRAAILGRIRAALRPDHAEGERPDAEVIAREAFSLLPPLDVLRPKFDDLTNRQRFIARATSERLTATVDEVADLPAAVVAIYGYLERAKVEKRIAIPPMAKLSKLDWGDIEVHHRIAPDEPVSVGLADFAIAETGTLIFTSRPDSPTLFNYMALHHVIIVDASTILRYMEDYWAIVRERGNIHPRNTNFITGTSGTADIEAKNIRGAHGPRFMHIVIVGREGVDASGA